MIIGAFIDWQVPFANMKPEIAVYAKMQNSARKNSTVMTVLARVTLIIRIRSVWTYCSSIQNLVID